jgi:polyphosphate kinase 2 (PPK2 family)
MANLEIPFSFGNYLVAHEIVLKKYFLDLTGKKNKQEFHGRTKIIKEGLTANSNYKQFSNRY